MVTAAMKSEDDCFLVGSYDKARQCFEKAEEQIANMCCIIEKAREFQKSFYLCFIDYAKAFDCVDHNKLQKTLIDMGIPDHLNLSPEKPACQSRSKSENQVWNNCLVQD